jgi:hypothetical protein
MEWKHVFWGLGALVAGLTIVVLLLPSTRRVERSIVVAADATAVFQLLNSQRGFDSVNPFRDDDPAIKTSFSGPNSGVGAAMAWESKNGDGSQIITSADPDRNIVMQLDLGAQGRPTQTFLIAPEGQGVRVTWRLDAKFGFNPIGRIVGQFMDGMLGPVYERGLQKIKVAAEKLSHDVSSKDNSRQELKGWCQ